VPTSAYQSGSRLLAAGAGVEALSGPACGVPARAGMGNGLGTALVEAQAEHRMAVASPIITTRRKYARAIDADPIGGSRVAP
jgi:hypothetical protein